MTDKELHRLSREDLLRLLLAQSKDMVRQKDELNAVREERDQLSESLGRLKEKLNEKDAQLARLKAKLDDKDALLEQLSAGNTEALPILRCVREVPVSSFAEAGSSVQGHAAAVPSGVSDDIKIIEQTLKNMDKKLEAMSRLLNDSDKETRHLRAVLFSMIS